MQYCTSCTKFLISFWQALDIFFDNVFMDSSAPGQLKWKKKLRKGELSSLTLARSKHFCSLLRSICGILATWKLGADKKNGRRRKEKGGDPSPLPSYRFLPSPQFSRHSRSQLFLSLLDLMSQLKQKLTKSCQKPIWKRCYKRERYSK